MDWMMAEWSSRHRHRPQFGKHRGAPRGCAAGAPGVLGNHHGIVKLQRAAAHQIEGQRNRHQLGHAGRFDALVGIVLVKNGARLVVEKDGVGAGAFKSLLRKERARDGKGKDQRGERECGRAPEWPCA